MLAGAMQRGPVYAFEAIDADLPFLPLAARRTLDLLGRKLSLEAWLALPLADRQRLVAAGAEALVDPEVLAVVDAARPAPLHVPARSDPDETAPPAALVTALLAAVPPRALDLARWRSLRALDRYALVKSAAKPDKLARAYDAIVASAPSPSTTGALSRLSLSHLGPTGDAHMIDVGAKGETARRAVASARVRTTRQTVEAIAAGSLAKGDVLAVARVAGILAAKKTPELVPLCHPVRTTSAAVELELDAAAGEVRVRATVEAVDRTGVEMEAMTAASVASLTVYDMIKSADRWATIEGVRLEEKSGGKSGEVKRPAPAVTSAPLVALRAEALSMDEALAHVKHAGAGALCVFLGTVRDHNVGRVVVRLEYEAYETMAVAEMKRIAEELMVETPGVRLAVLHRTGSLGVGEVAVVCAASAPHRGEAYAACRALIDRVKARVPIWKREHGDDGASWVGWEDARCASQGGEGGEGGDGHGHGE
jgi:molybdopterin synthase catalytic subunit